MGLMASQEVVTDTSCINVDKLREMTMDEFLSHFNLNGVIKEALLKESLDSVTRLFDCDMNDMTHICKTFSLFEKISIKDKVDFKQIMKQIIETIENEYIAKSKAKSSTEERSDSLNTSSLSDNSHNSSNNSSNSVTLPLIVSEKEHLLLSEMYDKLDQIIVKRKATNESLTLLNTTYDDNMLAINSYFNAIIELIKEKQSQLLKQFENKVKNKKEECNNALSKLNEFELLINKEIELIECDWFVNKTDISINNNGSNNNNNERRLIGSMLKEYILSPKKRYLNLENSMKKMKEFENENFKEIKKENTFPSTFPSFQVPHENGKLIESISDLIAKSIDIKIEDIPILILTEDDFEEMKEMKSENDGVSEQNKKNVQGSLEIVLGKENERGDKILKDDTFYETNCNKNEIFCNGTCDQNEMEPIQDELNETLIFEGCVSAARFDENDKSWRQRGQGTIKLFFNAAKYVIRLQFYDENYSKIRLSQTFCAYFDSKMIVSKDGVKYTILWENTDYSIPQSIKHGAWKITFSTSKTNIIQASQREQYLQDKMYQFLNIVKDFYYGLGLPTWCEKQCNIEIGSTKQVKCTYNNQFGAAIM